MSDKSELIECGEHLGIAEVADFHASLLTRLATGKPVDVDVSQIERIDCAALQLLYSYNNDIAKQGGQVNWLSPSDAFLRSADLLGMLKGLNVTAHV